jgi:two-component system chemotaxis response regulator CheY
MMKRRILLVDDNEKVRKNLKLMIESAGFVVEEAENGLDGLAKVKGQTFDGFVIDYKMPKVNGITLIKNILELPDYDSHQILLLSTEESSEFSALVAPLSLPNVMYKPVNPLKFSEILASFSQLAAA